MRFLLCAIVAVALASAGAHAWAYNETYDAGMAMQGWLLSKTAYCDIGSLATWTCTTCGLFPGAADVATYHDELTGAQAFSLYLPANKTIVVSFRGSDDIQNWIMDLDFFAEPCGWPTCVGRSGESCQCHRGFMAYYNAVKAPLLANVSALFAKYGNVSVLVTGHSLGAAGAIIAAVDLSLHFGALAPRLLTYTYGEPRVGNPAFAYWAATSVLPAGRQFRVTHKADPVPRLPPLEFGFLHVLHEVWYNNDLAGNTFTLCNDTATSEDLGCDGGQLAFATQDHTLYMGIEAGCSLP